MSPTDCSHFKELVADIGTPGAEPIDGWTGLLADGPLNAPVVRFYFVPGSERVSQEASRFLAAVQLLDKYIRPHYTDET